MGKVSIIKNWSLHKPCRGQNGPQVPLLGLIQYFQLIASHSNIYKMVSFVNHRFLIIYWLSKQAKAALSRRVNLCFACPGFYLQCMEYKNDFILLIIMEDTEQLCAKIVMFTALSWINTISFFKWKSISFFSFTIYKLGGYTTTTLCSKVGHSNWPRFRDYSILLCHIIIYKIYVPFKKYYDPKIDSYLASTFPVEAPVCCIVYEIPY